MKAGRVPGTPEIGVARTIRRAAVDMTLEEAFRLHDETFGPKARASSLACPAGDPCPGTGCPACCPSYDPCGEKDCRDCHPGGEMHVPEEAALKVGQANAMGLAEDLEECDWVVRHDTLETPDEYCGLPVLAGNEYCPEHQKNADAMAKRELEGKTCAYHCLTDGLTYIECPVHSPKNKEGDEPSTPREYPYTDGDIVVLGPGISVNPGKDVIYWEGRNFYPYDETPVREVTDKDRELIAANAKATIERRDRERAQKLLREMAMHHAVELQKAGLSAGHMPTKRVTEVADDILTWLTES